MNLQQSLKNEFESLVGFNVDLPADYNLAFEHACRHLAKSKLRTAKARRKHLIAHINTKFDVNKQRIAAVYALAASRGIVFNFHEKKLIQQSFDSRNKSAFTSSIKKTSHTKGLFKLLSDLFIPASEEETLTHFRAEVENPSKLRIEKGTRPVGNEILLSTMSAFIFSAADEEVMHKLFDPDYHPKTYEKSFWMQLRKSHPQLYSRNRTLDIARVNQALANECGSVEELRAVLFGQAHSSYQSIDNYGHLAYWIEPIVIDGRCVTWELCSDLMIFCEKHDETPLNKAYFRAAEIETETTSYIKDIDIASAQFEIANEGFTYKDTFVCTPNLESSAGSESLLVIFQKNKRDETIIPCPACRSHNVQGNSYPSLGVRSWECRNILCPDRSKYNRGKRYSFKSLLMQEAIDEVESQIPTESVRRWSRDVQIDCNIDDAVQMLLRHYSLHNDGVFLFGINAPRKLLGRRISKLKSINAIGSTPAENFFDSSWFKRYAVHSPKVNKNTDGIYKKTCLGSLTMIHGDSSTALDEFPRDYFDGAVTSPPYFNAREYSQWPNIYCYLHDMFKIAQSCYRVLKPGSIYLYNIFDYFDNERSIAFSAMGEKRLILSAYTVELFRRAGFQLIGSVTWDKGEIEGKRGFNAGNFSPYYQAPFNCWEHVLVFAKPPLGAAQHQVKMLPAILKAQPVIKMIRGQNTHGHTAPYPVELPNLLRGFLPPHEGRVLDPFGGSGTTARALNGFVSETVCVEKSEEYFNLSIQLFKNSLNKQEKAITQKELFDTETGMG